MLSYSETGTMAVAALVRTALAESECRLFKDGFVPSATSTLAEFQAQQCDFDGYTAGGKEITAFLPPLDNGDDGATLAAPTLQWEYTYPGSGDPVGNVVGGYYLVTSGDALIGYEVFPDPVPVTGDGDGVRVDVVVPVK